MHRSPPHPSQMIEQKETIDKLEEANAELRASQEVADSQEEEISALKEVIEER